MSVLISFASRLTCAPLSEQVPCEEELSDEGVRLRWPASLTAQLQALRKALYHKYVQEVAALKEQHSRELKRLREEREQERRREEWEKERGEKVPDLSGIEEAGSSSELSVTGRVVLEEKQHRQRVEEEVAKVSVHLVSYT